LPKKTDNLDDVYAYISEDDKNFELYNAVLRKNGGAGTRGNYKVARLLCGKITPLGQGIVLNPASDVKGIIPIMENRVEVVAAPDDAKSTLPNENISPVTTLDGVGSKKPAQIDMNHAPIPPDLEIYPLVAASVSNKNNNSNNKNVKIKLNDELKSAVASQLVNVKQFSKDEEGNDFALASVKLVDGATVKDVKVYGTDYITITFDGAVEDLNIGEITVYVPFVDSQLVAKRTIDVNSADLLKILADIEKNVKKVKDSLKID
jgi:hypothetical protein